MKTSCSNSPATITKRWESSSPRRCWQWRLNWMPCPSRSRCARPPAVEGKPWPCWSSVPSCCSSPWRGDKTQRLRGSCTRFLRVTWGRRPHIINIGDLSLFIATGNKTSMYQSTFNYLIHQKKTCFSGQVHWLSENAQYYSISIATKTSVLAPLVADCSEGPHTPSFTLFICHLWCVFFFCVL